MESHAFCMADRLQENRGERCLSTGEQNVDFSLRFEGYRPCEKVLHVLHMQFVNEASSVCIHIAGRTHHVAPVRQIDDQIRPSSRLDAVRAVIVYSFVADASEIPTESEAFHPPEEIRMIGKHVFEWAVLFARLSHQNALSFLQYFGF